MVNFGLHSEGLVLPRYADLLEIMLGSYEAETGVRVNREPGDVLYSIFVVLARQDDSQMELLQAIFDQQDPDNAVGVQLDLLSSVSGIRRKVAAPSSARMAIFGTPGTLIPEGKRVEDNNGVWWRLTTSTTIPGSGAAEAEAEAEIVGPNIPAVNVDVEIVNPVAGWDSAQFLTVAPGRLRELDADLRRRRVQSMQIRGTASVKAIRARLLALPTILAAVVVENDSPNVRTVEGIPSVPPHSVVPVIYAGGGVLTPDAAGDVARVLYEHVAAGIRCYGTDHSGTVVGEDGGTKEIAWSYAAEIPVHVEVRVSGVSPGSVEAEVRRRVSQYMETVQVGDALRRLPIVVTVGGIEGVTGVEVYLNAAPSDVVVTKTQVAVLDGVVAVNLI